MHLAFYDAEDATIPMDLSGNRSVMSISSLNHWINDFGDHIEKVGLGQNEFVKIIGSSIDQHGDYIYSENDNQYKENGALFNGDPTTDENGNVIDPGWDAINADGTPRVGNAYYGAGAMIYKGYPIEFVVGGNNEGLPTAFWFAANSAIAVPSKPEETDKPTPPVVPSRIVEWNRVYLVSETPTPTPQPKSKPTPKPDPQTPSAKKEIPTLPTVPVSTQEQAVLPSTGESSSISTLAVGAFLAIAGLGLVAKKREH